MYVKLVTYFSSDRRKVFQQHSKSKFTIRALTAMAARFEKHLLFSVFIGLDGRDN